MTLQTADSLFVVGGDADAEDAFALTASHGQQTVRRTALQGFLPIEVITVFGSFVAVGLGFHHLRSDKGLTTEGVAQLLTAALILADGLGNDVLSTLDGTRSILHFTFHETLCCPFWVALALQHQKLCQRFQTLFSGHLCPRAPLGFVGQVDILQFCGVPAGIDALLQFWRHLTQIGDGLDDRLLAFLNLLQPVETVADGCYLYLVETACALLAIA